MKNKRNIKRRGFTLVELLIVIVVIGVLSAMMMLSSTEAVTSARASNIVSNLRNFKTAAMAMYVDNLDEMDVKGELPTDANGANGQLVKYMNKGNSGAKAEDDTTNYTIVKGAADGKVAYYVCCSGVTDTRVQAKLAGRADSVGLLKDGTANTSNKYVSGGTSVYMFVTATSVTASSGSGSGSGSGGTGEVAGG